MKHLSTQTFSTDESSQQDMFGQGSDEEAEEEDKDDLKWRKERYEREKFLQESVRWHPVEQIYTLATHHHPLS